jgi:hypothetical protein
MAKRTRHPTTSPEELFPRVRLDSPGRDGGLIEFVHALAAILARLDAEERRDVQSDAPHESLGQRTEE